MAISNPTVGVYKRYDDTNNIEYKITYYKGEQAFRVFRQFHDSFGYHRLILKKVNIVNYEKDLHSLIQYIENELIRKNGFFSSNEKNSCFQGSHKKGKKVEFENSDKKLITSQTQNSDLKNHELERLFNEWEQAQKNEPDDLWKITNGGNNNISKNHFRRDGIIDNNIFEKEKIKVLFISSEANDNDYSARIQEKTSNIVDYLEFYRTGKDDWKGKMRERLAEMYKVICGIERDSLSNRDAVLHFAVMDINKRGGGAEIKKGRHIEAYCEHYSIFIRREIEIINPDIIAVIGVNLYKTDIHKKYLGAFRQDRNDYFDLNGKIVPVLSLWQTAYYQGKNEPLPGYEDNRIIGKQAARCVEELKRFGLLKI